MSTTMEEAPMEFMSPPRNIRKSLGGSRKSVHFTSPVLKEATAVASQANNDEQEKEQNKKQRENERKRRSVVTGFISTAEVSKPNSVSHRLNALQIKELLQNCVKLAAENKINVKNSWKLNLLDHMDEVMETTVGAETDQNFQLASCTLDAGVKIYTMRVDSVHTEAFKVLTGLSRVDKNKQDEEGREEDAEENGNTDEQQGDGKKEPSKRRRKNNAVTIETNANNLNVKKFEFEYCIEPLYHNVSASQYDVGSANSLLMNHLFISESADLMLDTSKYLVALEAGATVTVAEDVAVQIELPTEKKVAMFEALSEDALSKEQTEQDVLPATSAVIVEPVQNVEDAVQQVTVQQELMQPAPDMMETCATVADQVDEDVDMGAPIIAGGIDDDDDDHGGLFEQEFPADQVPILDEETAATADAPAANAAPPTLNPTQQVVMIEATDLEMNNEYAYFDASNMKKNLNWAGLSHWKFKPAPKTAVPAANQQTEKKKSKKNTVFSPDFFQEMSTEEFESAFEIAKTKTGNTMSSKSKSNNKELYLLPEDIHYDVSSLSRPFQFTSMKLVHKKQVLPSGESVVVSQLVPPRYTKHMKPVLQEQQQQGSSEQVHTGFDDDDDDHGAAIPLGGGFDDDMPLAQEQMEQQATVELPVAPIVEEQHEVVLQALPTDMATDSASTTTPASIVNGMNLIEKPQLVSKLNVKYETKPTKVDVRALKDHLWSSVTNKSEPADCFSQVLHKLSCEQEKQKLEQDKVRPENDFSQVSLPFAFMCLLHLANEHSLEITGNDELNDFAIVRTTSSTV